MKRLYLIIYSVLCTLAAAAQTIGEAFYIYRNDGQFNAFFREEVDSMAYSCYDTDSLLYEDIVSQIIYTQDSTYIIPLAAIDSVSFITPGTKYQPNVKVIEGDMRDYIVSSNELTISFKSDTPANLLPHVGDKLVTTEVSETFFSGFAGKVENIVNDGTMIIVTCSTVDLDEVFEEFYYVNDGHSEEMQVKGEHNRHNVSQTWEGSYCPGTFNIPLTAPLAAQFKPDREGDLSFSFAPEASVSITPTYRGKVVLIVSPKLGTVVSVDLSEEDAITENLTLSGAVDWTHDFTPGTVPIFNLGVPFLYFYGEVGAFIRANASVIMQQHWKQSFRYTFHYELNSRSFFTPRISFNGVRLESGHSGEVLVKGELGVGIYAELGVAFMAKSLLSAGGRAEAGIKLGGNTMLYKKDMENALHSTDVYKTLQGNDIHLSGFWNVGLQGQLLNWGVSHEFKALSGERVFARYSIVPDFSHVELVRDKEDNSILQASAKASGICLPQDLGFTLFEQEKLEKGQTNFSRYGYMGTSADIYASYFDMEKDKRYEVYPTVKLFGWDALTILAEPKAKEKSDDLCPDSNHPHMIDLGIGVKWACCNVGAHEPEGYGGYYAWGETAEKSVYNWSTYRHKDSNDNPVHIGDNISGTQYDAARVNWGAPWRMPTLDECKELVNKCSWTWTSYNGVNGRLVTGPNGNCIFLPAAGDRWDGELYGRGSWGNYWSGTLYPSGEWYAYYLGFYAGDKYWRTDDRSLGFSVRPISE